MEDVEGENFHRGSAAPAPIPEMEYSPDPHLLAAVVSGNWDDTYRCLVEIAPNGETTLITRNDEPVLTSRITHNGETALHMAVMAGRSEIVKGLVQMSDEDSHLILQNRSGNTALSLAAQAGIQEIAEFLVTTNKRLLGIPNDDKYAPIIVAAANGHKDMVRFLFHQTPIEDFDPDEGHTGVTLLNVCISAEICDIAFDLLSRYPLLAVVVDINNDSALLRLAQKPSLLQPKANVGDFGAISTILRTNLLNLISYPSSDKSQQLLQLIFGKVALLKEKQVTHIRLHDAVFEAVRHDNVKFIVEAIKTSPNILDYKDEDGRTIFLLATQRRKGKIVELLYTMDLNKNFIIAAVDQLGNNMLHQAALLPPSGLNLISGANSYMQMEIHWFQKMVSLLPECYKERKNKKGETPIELFREEHRKLNEESEKWMNETARYGTVIATLIITVMFDALLNVPGGTNPNTGLPIFLHADSFNFFLTYVICALLASTLAAFSFLTVLITPQHRNDILNPRFFLYISLCLLGMSITLMVLCFATTAFLVMQGVKTSNVYFTGIVMSVEGVSGFIFNIIIFWAILGYSSYWGKQKTYVG